jgi:hypothetical protein
MAKIDFKAQVLKDLAGTHFTKKESKKDAEGNEITDEKGKPVQVEVDFTIADAIQGNLLNEDPSGTPTEKFDKYLLAKKIKAGEGPIDITVEELNLIKTTVGKNPLPLVVGQVWEALESLESKK